MECGDRGGGRVAGGGKGGAAGFAVDGGGGRAAGDGGCLPRGDGARLHGGVPCLHAEAAAQRGECAEGGGMLRPAGIGAGMAAGGAGAGCDGFAFGAAILRRIAGAEE